jgi:hypothetical protein
LRGKSEASIIKKTNELIFGSKPKPAFLRETVGLCCELYFFIKGVLLLEVLSITLNLSIAKMHTAV